MNTFRLSFAAIAAIAVFVSCSDKDIPGIETPATPEKNIRYITINTSDAGLTRTEIVPSGDGGFTAKWKVGDQIDLFEVITGLTSGTDVSSNVKYVSEPLTESDIAADGSASFRVAIDTDRATLGTKFQYVAIYPHIPDNSPYTPFCSYQYWENESSEDYVWWKENWNYTDPEPVSPHPVFMVVMPSEQKPTATSFDPDCDMLLSGMITQNAQISGAASLPFARTGTVICITCKGLTEYAGKKITQAQFNFDNGYGGNQNAEYDPVLGKVMYYKGFAFTLFPQDVVIGNDGTAQLWIRGYSGVIRDWCSLRLTIDGELTDTGWGTAVVGGTNLTRIVNLAGTGRSISFAEGGLTKFGVSGFLLSDVSKEIEVYYCSNDDLNGFTATWHHNAAGISKYTCQLYSSDNTTLVSDLGEATINGDIATITIPDGLSTGSEYYLKVTAHAKDGHCFDSGNILDEVTGKTEYTTSRYVTVGGEDDYPVWFQQMYYQSYNENGKTPEEEWDSSKEYVWSNSSANLEFAYCHLDFETNSNGIILTSNASNTDWYIKSLQAYHQIKKIELMYDDTTNQNATIYLSNTPGGKDVTVTPTVSSRTVTYDFTSLSGKYQYFTIVDGGNGGVAKLFSIKIYYVN